MCSHRTGVSDSVHCLHIHLYTVSDVQLHHFILSNVLHMHRHIKAQGLLLSFLFRFIVNDITPVGKRREKIKQQMKLKSYAL